MFRADTGPPYASRDALDFIAQVGPPDILCVWGLGVDAALLDACAASLKIYNSIDAPALRLDDALAARMAERAEARAEARRRRGGRSRTRRRNGEVVDG